MDTKLFQQLKDLINQHTGLRILDDKNSFISLIHKRIQALKLDTEIEYYQLLSNFNPFDLAAEQQHLILGLTTGETYFFRDQGQMDLLRLHILPELIVRNKALRRLKLWSAGCSTGEEAYSLAMLLDELNLNLSGWEVFILATDINPEALAKAGLAHYGEWSFRQVSDERKHRFFDHTPPGWTLKPSIRKRVQFRHLNLVSANYPSPSNEIDQLDLILCRNVFIYLDSDIVSRISDKLTASLIEGGYLMTGHNELYAHHLRGLRTRVLSGSIVYQKSELHGAMKLLPLTESMPPKMDQPITPVYGQAKPRTEKTFAPRITSTDTPTALPPSSLSIEDAWVHANQGKPEQAHTCCNQLIAKNPLDHQPYYLSALLAQERGDRDEAKVLLKKTLYLAPDFIAAYLELGDIYARENNPALANKMWLSARKLLHKLPLDDKVEMFKDSNAAEILKFLDNKLDNQL